MLLVLELSRNIQYFEVQLYLNLYNISHMNSDPISLSHFFFLFSFKKPEIDFLCFILTVDHVESGILIGMWI
jgi:hypothetical protein